MVKSSKQLEQLRTLGLETITETELFFLLLISTFTLAEKREKKVYKFDFQGSPS